MTDTPRDAQIVATEQRALALIESPTCNSMLPVFVWMYVRFVREEPPLDTTEVFALGNFQHGRIANAAIESAVRQDYVTKLTLGGQQHPTLSPTPKLLAFVKVLTDIDAAAWDTEVAMLARSVPEQADLLDSLRRGD